MVKKAARNDRQAVIDQIRKKQKNADRRRNFVIIGVCVGIALVILGAAVVPIVMRSLALNEFRALDIDEVGAPADVCGDVTVEAAGEGNADHVEGPPQEQVAYPHAPPAFGDHWNIGGLAPDPMERKFYTEDDRPELEALVHNLEHGYTIVWYDGTVGGDQLNTLEAIARKFPGTDNFRHKIKIVPWTEEDAAESAEAGAANNGQFPDGQHIAFTHWSNGKSEAEGKAAPKEPSGVWQYCSEVSGAALQEFMLDYPYLDSPEPNAM